jgi:hypothetical protein
VDFGVIKFAVSKFIFELLLFGLVFVGGGREYAITVSKIIIELSKMVTCLYRIAYGSSPPQKNICKLKPFKLQL